MTVTNGYEVVNLVNQLGVTYSSTMRFRPGLGQAAAQQFKIHMQADSYLDGMRVNCVLRVKPKPIPENTP